MIKDQPFIDSAREVNYSELTKHAVRKVASHLLEDKSVFFLGREINVAGSAAKKQLADSLRDMREVNRSIKNFKNYLIDYAFDSIDRVECIKPSLRGRALFENVMVFYQEESSRNALFEYQFVPSKQSGQALQHSSQKTKASTKEQYLTPFLQNHWEEVKVGMPQYFQAKTVGDVVTIKLSKKTDDVMKVKLTLSGQQEYPVRVLLSTPESIQYVPLMSICESFDIKEMPEPLVIEIKLIDDVSVNLNFYDFLKNTPLIPSRTFMEFCHSAIGIEYLRYFSKQLRRGNTSLPMPCAEELYKKMHLRLDEFQNDKNYQLSQGDKRGIEKFKQCLVDNKKEGYPYCSALTLTYKFVYTISYLFFQYGRIGDEAHPRGRLYNILNAKDSFADCQMAARALSLEKLLSIPDCCFGGVEKIKCASCCIDHLGLIRRNSGVTGHVFEYVEKKPRDCVLCLPVSIDLTVIDFNRLAEYPITLLGVLTENYALHDENFMSPIDFLHHDGAHKYYNEQAIRSSHQMKPDQRVFLNRDVVSLVIRSAYLSFERFEFDKKEQRELFEIMFFELTHEVFVIDEALSFICSFVSEGLEIGGKFYGLEKTPQADALADTLKEMHNVAPIFEQFYKEIQNACIDKRVFDGEKAWKKNTSENEGKV